MHKKDCYRTKASNYGDLHHQGVTENELSALCVRIDETKTFYFSDILLL